jgi:hypothetical protein
VVVVVVVLLVEEVEVVVEEVEVVVVEQLLTVTQIKRSNCLDICQSKLLFVPHPICLEGIAMLLNYFVCS